MNRGEYAEWVLNCPEGEYAAELQSLLWELCVFVLRSSVSSQLSEDLRDKLAIVLEGKTNGSM